MECAFAARGWNVNKIILLFPRLKYQQTLKERTVDRSIVSRYFASPKNLTYERKGRRCSRSVPKKKVDRSRVIRCRKHSRQLRSSFASIVVANYERGRSSSPDFAAHARRHAQRARRSINAGLACCAGSRTQLRSLARDASVRMHTPCAYAARADA